MAHGYMGKILMVNLSDKTFEVQQIPDTVYEKFLSGSGLGGFILYNNIPADADPLGPDNVLGFVSGLLTGTGSLFTGRWMVMGKSIKRCGYDGIFFKGISDKPVYLYIKNGKPELKDAGLLWGKDAIDTEEMLISELTDKRNPKVACIGPAGEKLSCISGISNDLGRMAARSGLGAVMGSKRLKAIVLDSAKKIEARNRYKIRELSDKCNK
jgi:aldehyde:ferredoxin oxidoreductase